MVEDSVKQKIHGAFELARALGPTQVPVRPAGSEELLSLSGLNQQNIAPGGSQRQQKVVLGPTGPHKKVTYLVIDKRELREAAQPLIDALLADGATDQIIQYRPKSISVALPKDLTDHTRNLDERAAGLVAECLAAVEKMARPVKIPLLQRDVF